MSVQSLWTMLAGNFTSGQLIIYVTVQVLIFAALLIAARLRYPQENQFSIMTCTMSYLGSKDAERNPEGWFFFGIATSLISLFDIPLMIYFYKYFQSFAPTGARIALIFNIFSTAGGIMVSIFPDTSDEDREGGDFVKDLRAGQIHNITAVITFLAYIAGNFTFGLCYIVHPSQRPPVLWLPPLIYFIIVFIGFLTTQAIWQLKCKKNLTLESWPGEGVFSFPLWEWILFLSLYIFLFWNLFII